MQIKRVSGSARPGFWPGTREWLRSRRGFVQSLLATGLGIGLAAAAGGWYATSGKGIVDLAVSGLLAQARKTVDTVIDANDLPTLFFDIGFQEYQTMARQRDEALRTGILLLGDEDWQPARIRFAGETVPVRVRLKGDWTDHLHEDKWSFRVKTRGDAAIEGMRSFSVQAPFTRRYLNEWLFLEDLRREGILAPRYSFVNVVVNGEPWGIYALEESFSGELLESQSRREGVIVRLDESLFWERRALFNDRAGGDWKLYVDPIATTFELAGFALADEFNTTSVQSDPALRQQSATALGLLRAFQERKLMASQVFDAELMGRYIAHTNLWGARHGLTWHNERHYYNPLTSRLEPIGYDTLPLDPGLAHLTDLGKYDDLEIMRAYAREMERISRPEYLEEFRSAYEAEFERYSAALAREFPPENLRPPWDMLTQRQALLRGALRPPQAVYAHQASDGLGPTVDVDVGSLLRYPVVLHRLQSGDRSLEVRPEWVAEDDVALTHPEAAPAVVLRRASKSVPKYVTLRVPANAFNALVPAGTPEVSRTLQIVTSLVGVGEQIVADVRRDYPPVLTSPLLPDQPTVEEALKRHPFLALSDQPGFLELKAGTWEVKGDLVLPDGMGLSGTRSTTLRFDRDAIFFANGPLLLRGPDSGSLPESRAGIRLMPKQDHWSGLFVMQADPDVASLLSNVEVRATRGIQRGGWFATGGVTFYESPVVLDRCRLVDSAAEDTINVVRSRFEFSRTEFGDAASDGFDGDFAQGTVRDCAFHDIRGDAIDVSGSEIIVQDIRLLRVYDKGISAGEASVVTAKGIYAEDVSMVVVSKDLSDVNVRDVRIARAWTAAFAAYVKKLEYGPASIRASHVVFEDESVRALVQEGSSVWVDGTDVPAGDLDVDALYERQDAVAAMVDVSYRFGSAIRLLGYTMPVAKLDAGDELSLILYWQALAEPDRDYTVFVHVLDAEGEIVAQWDTMPRDSAYPTTQWLVGELVDDCHSVPLPSDLPAGEYRVSLGLYHWQTGEHLPVHGESDAMVPGARVVLGQTVRVR